MKDDRIERQPPAPERTMADLYPAETTKRVKIHRMRDDFRLPEQNRWKTLFKKLTDEEFERERLRQIQHEDSWMGRGRGY